MPTVLYFFFFSDTEPFEPEWTEIDTADTDIWVEINTFDE